MIIVAWIIFLLAAGVCWWIENVGTLAPTSSFNWLSGFVFGFILQRSRFCFLCIFRDLFEKKIAAGALGLLVALGAGILLYNVVVGGWVVDPLAGYLPPKAHIAPAGWHLLLAGFLFGCGMALSGSCISAHLYRLGEGAVPSLFALFGAVLGFGVGFLSWNWLYLNVISESPTVWLPARMGYHFSFFLQAGILAALGLGIWWYCRKQVKPQSRDEQTNGLQELWENVFVARWPSWIAGLSLAVLAAFVLLRSQPLGVTAELSRVSRDFWEFSGLLPSRLEGLDQIRGCSAPSQSSGISSNGFFVLAMIGGSLFAALLSREFSWEWCNTRELILHVVGGVALGMGSMWALGCSVGTLLSGVMASSLSGWIFGFAMVLGILLGLFFRRKWLPSKAQS